MRHCVIQKGEIVASRTFIYMLFLSYYIFYKMLI